MKLSFGFVRGDHIACLYHGWQYDRARLLPVYSCAPQNSMSRKTFKVPSYPSQEQDGMIWTTLSENPLPLHVGSDPTVPLRSLYLDCGIDTAIAALGTVQLVSVYVPGCYPRPSSVV